MAAKKNTTSNSASPELRIEFGAADQQLRDRIAKGRELIAATPGDELSLEEAKAQYFTWDEYNGTLLARIFSTPALMKEYSYWGIVVVGGRTPLYERIEEFKNDVSKKIRRLESVLERLPLYVPNDATAAAPTPVVASKSTRKVFVVHGRNNELKEAVARYLSQLDLTPIILHEQANEGRTIIEKFESNADSCFAVVLLTPDDLGRLATTTAIDAFNPRARQNVIFEWGFFVAKLGRRNVCALVVEGLEMPSDVHGVVYVTLDAEGAWRLLLARELKAGGVAIDLNRVI